jgi:NAD(P)-dependent dehydrogenase (short-subunit alcohol dehydrogenase family)
MERSVVITGANRGIGLELARRYAQAGDCVVATTRRRVPGDPLDQLAGSAPERVQAVKVDVNRQDQVDGLRSRVEVVDLLINNAGVLRESFDDRAIPDPAVVEDTLRTNTVAPVRVTAALLPALQAAARPIVVNLTSGLGSIAECSGGVAAYRMSKAALNMFTRCLATDYPDIICVALHPGWVRTDMGGANATLGVDESCEAMDRFIASLTPNHSGGFFSFRGDQIPW